MNYFICLFLLTMPFFWLNTAIARAQDNEPGYSPTGTLSIGDTPSLNPFPAAIEVEDGDAIAPVDVPNPLPLTNLNGGISKAARDLLPVATPLPTMTTAQAETSPPAEKTATPAGATEADAAKLAQAAQNPIANLISVPFQNNFNGNIGPLNQTQYVLNVQPVIPVSLGPGWLLVNRIITPIINQPGIRISPSSDPSFPPELQRFPA